MPIESRTFGAEFECYLPEGATRDACAAALSSRIGKPVVAEDYNHAARSHWKIVTDGSLGDYQRGIEIVSPSLPPLQGDEGLAEMQKICEALTDFGCTVSKRTGTHIHVGVGPQNIGFFQRLVRLYQTYEPVIDGLMPTSRRASANTYCRSICGTSPSQVAAAGTWQDLAARIWRNSGAAADRYHKLNLTSYGKYRTVEFRQHSGTLDPVKARNWALICLRMVEAATDPALTFEVSSERPRNQARQGSKRHTIVEMILRPNGATRTEIVAATDWPSVSIAQIATANNLDIITERQGRETRYRLNAVVSAAIDRPITIQGFCATIGATDTERAYIETRTANLSGPVAWAA